jgi:hypothetical protein
MEFVMQNQDQPPIPLCQCGLPKGKATWSGHVNLIDLDLVLLQEIIWIHELVIRRCCQQVRPGVAEIEFLDRASARRFGALLDKDDDDGDLKPVSWQFARDGFAVQITSDLMDLLERLGLTTGAQFFGPYPEPVSEKELAQHAAGIPLWPAEFAPIDPNDPRTPQEGMAQFLEAVEERLGR